MANEPVSIARREASPVLEESATAPKKNVIGIGGSDKKSTSVLVVALTCIALAGAAGLFASYFKLQEDQQFAKKSEDFSLLAQQLSSGETGENVALVKTTAAQLTAFTTAVQSVAPWNDLLTVFAGRVPGSVSISNANFDDASTSLRIDGTGITYSDIATFMAAFTASDRFSNPSLGSTAQTEEEGEVKTSFTMTVDYLPAPVPSATPTSPVGITQ